MGFYCIFVHIGLTGPGEVENFPRMVRSHYPPDTGQPHKQNDLMQMLTLYVLCMCNNCIKFKVIGYVFYNNIIRISTVNINGAFRKWGTVLSYNPFRAGTDFGRQILMSKVGPRIERINIFVMAAALPISLTAARCARKCRCSARKGRCSAHKGRCSACKGRCSACKGRCNIRL